MPHCFISPIPPEHCLPQPIYYLSVYPYALSAFPVAKTGDRSKNIYIQPPKLLKLYSPTAPYSRQMFTKQKSRKPPRRGYQSCQSNKKHIGKKRNAFLRSFLFIPLSFAVLPFQGNPLSILPNRLCGISNNEVQHF